MNPPKNRFLNYERSIRMSIKSFLDFVFPPLCLACKEPAETKFLCPQCWDLCTLPDPIERCRHCFKELDRSSALCSQCLNRPLLLVARAHVFDAESPAFVLGREHTYAMAGFAVALWTQLDWPVPDVIVPMPDKDSIAIGRAFAELLDLPFVRALQFNCEYKEDRLEEEKIQLLFDVLNPIEKLQKSSLSLSESFPKRIYLLSLYQ